MSEDAFQGTNARQKFENRVSERGRFQSYARGRLSHFPGRQILTLIGALILALLSDPAIGAAALAIAFLGEAVDCLTLGLLLRHGRTGVAARALSTATAAMQAGSISACVWLGWTATAGPEARFFAVAYLCGAVINAGLVYPYHRRATEARMVVYILSIGIFFALDGLSGRGGEVELVFDCLATVMLGYMAYSFIGFVLRSYARRIAMERDLITRQDQLDRSLASLRTREREARQLALVAANANDSVIVTDRTGRIEYTNASFTRITGYTLDEARGRTPAELLNSPNTDTQAIDAIFRARDMHAPLRMELLNRTKHGDDIWVETNITPMLDESGNVLGEVAIERDITRSKQREQELARAKTAAEEGARAKAQFLAMISHEIRTPLNGIIGMSDVMLASNPPDEYKQAAETILNSGESLLTIINDILDLSKLEAGKMEIEEIAFDLKAQLETAFALVRPLGDEKGLKMDLVFDGLADGRIMGDPGRVRQVFLNLLGNAIKFTTAGRVTAVVSFQKAKMIVRVRDTGIGIPADRLEHIFDAFAQADSDTTRHFGGTGLGLAISRQLARQMGGDIRVTSRPGEGSCFEMSFATRWAEPREGHGGNIPAPSGGEVELPDGLRILVAEDNRTNQLLIGKLLARFSDGVQFARDGIEAVEMYDREKPDIVLMDMSMPRCDGLDATRRIRAMEVAKGAPRCPIIALTANAFASDRTRCLNAGMDGFLTKPIRRKELFAALSEQRATGPQRLAAEGSCAAKRAAV